jgi:hypothetical protein
LLGMAPGPTTFPLEDQPNGGHTIKGELLIKVDVREGFFVEGRVGQVDKKLREKMLELVHSVRAAMGQYSDSQVTKSDIPNSVLRVQLVDAQGLACTDGVVAMIRVNNVEKARSSVGRAGSVVKWPADVGENCFILSVPEAQKPAMELCIELWASDATTCQLMDFLGQVTFRNEKLARMPRGDVEWDLEKKPGAGLTFNKLVQGNLCLSMVWTPLQPAEARPAASLRHLHWNDFTPSTGGGERLLRLEVVRAHDLPRADTFGSSDPYCIVKWGGKEVGRTKVIWNTLEPIYEDEVFFLPIAESQKTADLKLEVELWDKDVMGPGDLLGALTLKGESILSRVPSQDFSYELERKGKKQGRVLLSLRDHDPRFTKEVIDLTIQEAHGLANADFMGKSDPVVIVFWNAQEVARTRCINDTLDPVWNEKFLLHIPVDRTEITLRLEVWDMDVAGMGDFLGEIHLGVDEILQPRAITERYKLQKKPHQTQKLGLIQGYLEIRWEHRRLVAMELPPEKAVVLPKKEIHNFGVDVLVAEDPVAEELRRKKEGLQMPDTMARVLALAELCDSVLGNPAYRKGMEYAAFEDQVEMKEGEAGQEDEDEDEDEDDEEDEETEDSGLSLYEQPDPESSLMAEITSGQMVTTVVKKIASTVLRGIFYDRLVVTFYDNTGRAENSPSPGLALVVYCRAKEVYKDDRAFGRQLGEHLTQELGIVRRRQLRRDNRQQALFRITDLCVAHRFGDMSSETKSVQLAREVRLLVAKALGEECGVVVHLLESSGQSLLQVAGLDAELAGPKGLIRRQRNAPDADGFLFSCADLGAVWLSADGELRRGHAAWNGMAQAELVPAADQGPPPSREFVMVPLWSHNHALGVLEVANIRSLNLEGLPDESQEVVPPLRLEDGMLDFLVAAGKHLGRSLARERKRKCLEELSNIRVGDVTEVAPILRRAALGIREALPAISGIGVWTMTITTDLSLKPVVVKEEASEKETKADAVVEELASPRADAEAKPAPASPPSQKTARNAAADSEAPAAQEDAEGGEGKGSDGKKAVGKDDDEDEEEDAEPAQAAEGSSWGALKGFVAKTLAAVQGDSGGGEAKPLIPTIQSAISNLLTGGPARILNLTETALKIPPWVQMSIKITDRMVTVTRAGVFKFQPLDGTESSVGLLTREWYRSTELNGSTQPFWGSRDQLLSPVTIRKPRRARRSSGEDDEDEDEEDGKRGQKKKTVERLAIVVQGAFDGVDVKFISDVAALVSELLSQKEAKALSLPQKE